MDGHQDAYEWERSCHHSVVLRVVGAAAVVLVVALLAVMLANGIQTFRDADWRISGIPDIAFGASAAHGFTG
jgi:hypothetical protein